MTIATLARRTNPANEARKVSAAEKKAAILAACRELMLAGCFRPTTVQIADQVGIRPHDVINRFTSLSALYEAGLDNDTVRAIARLIMRGDPEDVLLLDDMRSLARAAVFGRIEP